MGGMVFFVSATSLFVDERKGSHVRWAEGRVCTHPRHGKSTSSPDFPLSSFSAHWCLRGWVHLTASRVAVKQTRMDPTVLILTFPDHNSKNFEFAIMP